MVALLLASPAAAREKSDVLILVNGDRITGEIKGMSRGKLDFNTDDAGRLSVEWLKVSRVTTAHYYEVELSSGLRHYGNLAEPPADAKGMVTLGDGTALRVPEIVAITSLEDDFFQRLRAYLDFGFTLAKANRATTLNTAGEVAYRGERVGATLSFDAYVQDDESNAAVSRANLGLVGDYYFTRWRAVLLAGLTTNDELALKLRISAGGGAAYTILQSNSMVLWATGGLVGTREAYAESDPQLNLDAFVAGTWEAYRYDSPKVDVSVSAAVFPSLTDLGRVRGDLTLRVKYELFRDFNVGLAFSDTFDSRPPDPAASKNDFVASFTIGWSYRR
jgi:hypothetical protein